MKAFLLAAGKGTRLRPLTDRIPKCLVPIGEKPLLQIWFDQLAACGVTEVLVNTHHLSEQVEAYVEQHPMDHLRVTLFHEPELLGSAGTVWANRSFVRDEKDFLIIYADNLTDMDLTDFERFHREKKSAFSLVLFKTPNPTECGVALCDSTGRVTAFQEKPKHPESDWANAGIYLAGQELFQMEPPECAVFDFGFHVLPEWVGRMYGYRYEGFYCDTGTPERLQRARAHWGAA